MRSVPRFVVLSGCETGLSSAALEQPGIGLAQAFIVSGAAAVIASVRPVADTTAARLTADFYREWLHGVPAARALQAAELGLRGSTSVEEWTAFRLFER
jgi:CHAT domain-containing protein